MRRGVVCARNFVGIGEANKVRIFLELAFSTQLCRSSLYLDLATFRQGIDLVLATAQQKMGQTS